MTRQRSSETGELMVGPLVGVGVRLELIATGQAAIVTAQPKTGRTSLDCCTSSRPCLSRQTRSRTLPEHRPRHALAGGGSPRGRRDCVSFWQRVQRLPSPDGHGGPNAKITAPQSASDVRSGFTA